MKSQPTIYSKNKPRFTSVGVNYRFTQFMVITFGERLREKLNEQGITAAELSRRAGVTKQNIGRLLNNTPHTITGAWPRVEPDTVIKLATPLEWNVDDALEAAGFSRQNEGRSFYLGKDVRVSLYYKNLPERHLQLFQIAMQGALDTAVQIIEDGLLADAGTLKITIDADSKPADQRRTG